MKIEAQLAMTRLQNGEPESIILSGLELHDYRYALDLAKSLGQSLRDALREYADAKELAGGRHLVPMVDRDAKIHPVDFPECMVAEAVEGWIASKELSDNVACTKECSKGRIRRFARTVGGTLQDVNATGINDYVESQTQNGRTRSLIRGTIVEFILWCVTTKFISGAQLDLTQLHRYRTRRNAKEIYRPQDLTAIIGACDATFVLLVVLVAFGAVRAAEAARLQWEDVRWDERRIWISEVVSKTGESRWTPICDTLMQFLAPWRGSQGPISWFCQNHTMAEVSKLARMLKKKYASDILRHSYASYRIPVVNGDLALVSSEMGNSPNILKKHYWNRVIDLADIPLYWAITPCAHNATLSKFWTEGRWRCFLKKRTAKLWVELEERAGNLPRTDLEARAPKINEITQRAYAFMDTAPFITPDYSIATGEARQWGRAA
jgi:hypothetical protein